MHICGGMRYSLSRRSIMHTPHCISLDSVSYACTYACMVCVCVCVFCVLCVRMHNVCALFQPGPPCERLSYVTHLTHGEPI